MEDMPTSPHPDKSPECTSELEQKHGLTHDQVNRIATIGYWGLLAAYGALTAYEIWKKRKKTSTRLH